MARMRQQGGIWAGDKIGKDEGRREEKEGEEAVAAILEVRMRCMMSINHPSRALVGSIRDGACPKERKENDFLQSKFLGHIPQIQRNFRDITAIRRKGT